MTKANKSGRATNTELRYLLSIDKEDPKTWVQKGINLFKGGMSILEYVEIALLNDDLRRKVVGIEILNTCKGLKKFLDTQGTSARLCGQKIDLGVAFRAPVDQALFEEAAAAQGSNRVIRATPAAAADRNVPRNTFIEVELPMDEGRLAQLLSNTRQDNRVFTTKNGRVKGTCSNQSCAFACSDVTEKMTEAKISKEKRAADMAQFKKARFEEGFN